MALDWGPLSAVRIPGPSASAESRDVAKVRVTKGSEEVAVPGCAVEEDGGGR
jgi:hypothetical protein